MILKDLGGKIGRFVRGHLAVRAGRVATAGIARHCLHAYPVPKGVKPVRMVVFYSGDGGWARLPGHLSDHLRSAGFPVVGIDCMHYFWKEKEPGEAARDLATAVTHYSAEWGVRELVLLGYSMGADVVPLIVRHVPDDVRARIAHVVLMSPSHHVCLRFRFIGWLGYESAPRHRHSILPDLEAIAPIQVTLFAGAKEDGSLVHAVAPAKFTVELLPGGHHYGGDYATLAGRVLATLTGDPLIHLERDL